MQLSFLLYVSVALAGLLVNAAPLPSDTTDAVSAPPPAVPSTGDHDLNDLINVLQARKSKLSGLGSLLGKLKPKPKAPKIPVKAPPKPAAPAKPAPPPPAKPAPPPPAKPAPPPVAAPPAKSAPAKTTAAAASKTSASAAATSSAAFCPLYTKADAQDISQRDLEEIYARAGEEFWFRWEDPSIAKGGSILQLAARGGAKNFDDQAYKWISTNAASVTRSSFGNRLPTIYVMPAGTAKSLLAKAEKFEETSEAEKAADFVTKDNEPGDIGVNGVAKSEDGTLPLDQVRNKVIRTVVKTSSKGSQQFVTIGKNGKASKTAAKADQALLNKISC